MGVAITQSASSASRTGSGQSHEIALMATKKSSSDTPAHFGRFDVLNEAEWRLVKKQPCGLSCAAFLACPFPLF